MKKKEQKEIVRDYIYEFGKRTGAGDSSTGKTAIYRNYPVKTGDVAPIAVLAAMSGISAGVLTAVERWKRKKKIRELGRTGQAGVRDLFFFDCDYNR